MEFGLLSSDAATVTPVRMGSSACLLDQVYLTPRPHALMLLHQL